MGCTFNKSSVRFKDEFEIKIQRHIDRLSRICSNPIPKKNKALIGVELLVRAIIYDIICVCDEMGTREYLVPSVYHKFYHCYENFCLLYPSIALKIENIAEKCFDAIRAKTFKTKEEEDIYHIEMNNRKRMNHQSKPESVQDPNPSNSKSEQLNLYERRRGRLLQLNSDVIVETDMGFLELLPYEEYDCTNTKKRPSH
mmetsp:Transcript_33678/g.34302  ORF Transcript_33678/g.34302 Transcript_33678/m.34302 type:complete len:198 (-) Transcript_33678:180-773(-)